MFERFYNLAYNPFSKTLKASDAYDTEDMREVHNRLDHLARTGGIGLVTADPGMGKTFAVRTWAAKQNPNTAKCVYVCLSTVSGMEFYRQLCLELGITPAFKKVDMFRDLQAHLRHLALEKRVKVTVVLDEAQYLSPSILRDLKMLTNFDMDSRDCFACVLVGQSVLVQYLSRQPYEALRQRLVVNYQMEGPDEAQARDYVREMLRRAGGDPALFDDAALASAYGACGGSIRRLNSIVVNAMMIGSQLEARHIDAGVVLKAIEEASLQ